MHIAEICRYPVKSLAGEMLPESEVTLMGLPHDREIVVLHGDRVVTARRYPKLLALRGSLDANGRPTVNGHLWNSAEARALVESAVGGPVELVQVRGPERFDVLPLLVATDGAVAQLGVDRRRFRPNILVGGVPGLAERTWPGRTIRLGPVLIAAAQLRERCVMTTYDPDTQVQDIGVLKRIVAEFDGTFALDCSVLQPGSIRLGDPVELR
jgi:uncharacterized protein YcbX